MCKSYKDTPHNSGLQLSFKTFSTTSTKCISNLDMFNLIWWLDFRLEPIFAKVPTASRNTSCFKSDLKIIILLVLPRLSQNHRYTLYFIKLILGKTTQLKEFPKQADPFPTKLFSSPFLVLTSFLKATFGGKTNSKNP